MSLYKSGIALLLAAALSGCAGTDRTVSQSSDYTRNSGGSLKPAQAAFTLEHADLAFKVYPDDKTLAGSATLTLKVLQSFNELALDLDRVYVIKAITVDGALVDASDWNNPKGLLSIQLANKRAVGDVVKVKIDYEGQPHEAIDPPWDGGFVWDTTKSGQPWIATAVQSNGCDIFWPCVDHPLREPQAVDIHITVPKPLVAASNGTFEGVEEDGDWRTWHWRSEVPVNTYAVALNIGPYELMEDTYQSHFGNTIKLQYWHLEEHTQDAGKLFAEFAPTLQFYESMIGPYPFGHEKMGVVDTPHLGMEHQTINAYGNKYKPGEFGFDWLLHHEFAHEYFGNQMTHKDLDDMWLHEGFGDYMQILYAQYLHGQRAYHSYLAKKRFKLKNKAPLVSGRAMNDQDVYVDGPAMDLYNKGSWFLHTLRHQIGDEAFFRSIRLLVYGTDNPQPGNFSPRIASTTDYLNIVNEVTGKDNEWLFKAYLYHAELPELKVNRGESQVDFSWELPDGSTFAMPLEVQVNGRRVTLDMANGKGSVRARRGEVVIADPDSKILRHEPHVEAFRAYQKKAKKASGK